MQSLFEKYKDNEEILDDFIKFSLAIGQIGYVDELVLKIAAHPPHLTDLIIASMLSETMFNLPPELMAEFLIEVEKTRHHLLKQYSQKP